MQVIINFFTAILGQLYLITGNVGLAVIVFTLIIRFILWPITVRSLKVKKEMEKIQPELKKLKKKHKKDRQALQVAQMSLYKKYNINPMAGCLPQILQFAVLIFLYRGLIDFLGQSSIQGVDIIPDFLWLDLSKPDHLYVLPVVAALSQLVFSLMIAPGGETRDIVPNKSKSKKIKKENKKEENMAEMAASMQQQMIFVLPVMTGIFALQFPSGLALYWVFSTAFSVVQQYIIAGPGGLKSYSARLLSLINKS